MTDNIIGSRIRELRQQAGETQKGLGKAINITPVDICRYEKQVRIPSIRAVIAIAKHYNVSTDYILGMELVREGETE